MRKEIREFLNQDKNKKRHKSEVIVNRKRADRPPPGFNHWPTFDEIVQVLSVKIARDEIKRQDIEKLNYKIVRKAHIETKDEALEKLLQSLGVKN